MTRHCEASVMLLNGNTTINFTTRANTEDGILKACGKAIARQLRDDAIMVYGIKYDYPESTDPFKWRHISVGMLNRKESVLMNALKNELFDVMYG